MIKLLPLLRFSNENLKSSAVDRRRRVICTGTRIDGGEGKRIGFSVVDDEVDEGVSTVNLVSGVYIYTHHTYRQPSYNGKN